MTNTKAVKLNINIIQCMTLSDYPSDNSQLQTCDISIPYYRLT
jgi:hypothetical protein